MRLYLHTAASISQDRLFHLSEMNYLTSLKSPPVGPPKMNIVADFSILFCFPRFFSVYSLQETDVVTDGERVGFRQQNQFPSCKEEEIK